MLIWFKRLFCDHWWKAMRSFSSAYFVYPEDHSIYIEYEAHECKLCGKSKMEKHSLEIAQW